MSQATDDERQTVWETLLLHSTHGKIHHGDFKLVGEEFGLSPKAVSRIWHQGSSSMVDRKAAVDKSRAGPRGRKKVSRVDLCRRIAAVPIADRNNQLTLQLATNTSYYLVQQLLKEGYLRQTLLRTRPLLTQKHKDARMQFCADRVRKMADGTHRFDPLLDVVHIDEKWFYIKKAGKKVYMLMGKEDTPEEEAPAQYVKSKRHLLKVMFSCAVARPRGDWDGKVGMWPIVEGYLTQRASVNREAGVVELKPVNMTREIARRMITEDVIPAIKAKWPLKAAGSSDGWNISLTNQPAQSPGLNALDVDFFCSIQALQSQTVPRKIEELIAEVEHAFEDTTATTLTKTFITLQLMMGQIMRRHGGNDFRLTHFKKDHLLRSGSLRIDLPCDSQLYFDTVAAIAPPPTVHIPSDLDYLS